MTRILVASIVALALVLGGVIYAVGSMGNDAGPGNGQSAAVING